MKSKKSLKEYFKLVSKLTQDTAGKFLKVTLEILRKSLKVILVITRKHETYTRFLKLILKSKKKVLGVFWDSFETFVKYYRKT